MIRDVYPGFRIWIFPIPDPGVKNRRIPDPDPQHCLSVKFKYMLKNLLGIRWDTLSWLGSVSAFLVAPFFSECEQILIHLT
jgi:hypothetical protein